MIVPGRRQLFLDRLQRQSLTVALGGIYAGMGFRGLMDSVSCRTATVRSRTAIPFLVLIRTSLGARERTGDN